MSVFRSLLCFAMLVSCVCGQAFRITDAGNVRGDMVADWAGFSTVDGTVFPDFEPIPTSDAGRQLLVLGVGASVRNRPGTSLGGVLLSNPGERQVFLYPPEGVQGFGVVIEHLAAGPAELRLNLFLGSTGEFVDSVSLKIPDGSVPTFIGFIDPDARAGIIGVESLGGGDFVMGNPSLQFRRVPETDPAKLPSVSTLTVELNPLETYFHQGFANRTADEATQTATQTNENVHDLQSFFPGLRAGDVLLLERQGSPLDADGSANPVLGVFSGSEVLEEGTKFRRVPGAVAAGQGYQTSPISSELGVLTPTNLPEDFVIGSATYAVMPPGARYVFLSRERPGAGLTPVAVRMGHIPRLVFEAWVEERGLVGSLADPNGDADGDGLRLIEEFVYGKDPMLVDSQKRKAFSFAPFADEASGRQGRLVMLFGARRDGPVSARAQVSSNLTDWTTLPENAVQPLLGDGTSDGRAVFGFTDPVGGPRRFGRLKLEYIPPTTF